MNGDYLWYFWEKFFQHTVTTTQETEIYIEGDMKRDKKKKRLKKSYREIW